MVTFTDTFTGVDGSLPSSTDWIVENTTGSTSTIQSNTLRMVTGAAGGYADKTILTWTGPLAADVEIDLDITPASTAESYFEFALRATNPGSSLTQNGYRFEVAFNGFVSIMRQDNFASTTLASGVQVAGFGAGVTVHVQASVYGSTLALYAWTGSTRPDTPTLQAIDATWRNAGYVVFEVLGGNAAASQTWTVDNASIDVLVSGGRLAQFGRGLPSATPYGLGLPLLTLPAMSSGVAATGTDFTVQVDDSAGLTDAQTLDVGREITDSAGLVDTRATTSATTVTDSAGLVDTRALTTGRVLTDSAGLTDTPLTGPLTAARGVNNSDGAYNVKPDGVWGTFPGTYGSQWHYDASASLTYLASRGIKFTRLPITWERIQPTRGAALDSAEQARITSYLDACQTAGIRVVIEPHNYARYREGAYPSPGITLRTLGVDLPVADIVDLWTRLATAFGSHPAVYGWELTNEPYDLFGRVDSGATFAATFDTTASGWTTDNATMTRSSTTVRTGAGSLQVTASGAGTANAQHAVTVSGSITFSAWVRSNGAARSAQFDVNWYNAAGAYITSTSGGSATTSTSWQQVSWTATPPVGAVWGDFVMQVLSPAAGEVFYWDDVTSGTNGSLTQATLWEDACQRCVTAVRAAGDTHRIYVPGYNWQNPATWRDNHPDPFVADPAGKITYSAHFYFDDSDDGTYAATYAQETTNATGQGYTSVTDRTVSKINQFVAWCTQFGVAGAFTELGWPHNSDAASWNAVADAVYSRLDQVNMDAWVWATGEWYGTTSILTPYETGGGSTLSTAQAQATVIEAHLGAGPGTDWTVTVNDPAGAADTQALTVGRATTDAAGVTETSALTVGRAIIDPAGLVDTQGLGSSTAVTDAAGLADVASATVGRQVDDPAGLVDTAFAAHGLVAQLDDPVGLLDGQAVTVTRQVDDPAAGTDSTALTAAWVRAVTDDIGLTDTTSAAKSGSGVLTLEDAAGLVDAAVTAGTWLRQVDDPAGSTDSTSPAVGAALSDTAGAADTQDLAVARAVTDLAGAGDSTAAAVARQVDDPAGSADAAAVTLGRQADDPAGLVDAAALAGQWVRPVTDDAGLADAATALKSGSQAYTITDPAGATDALAAAGTWLRQVDDPAGLADSTTPAVDRRVDDTSAVTDTVARVMFVNWPISDLVGLTDAAAQVSTTLRAVTDGVGLTDDEVVFFLADVIPVRVTSSSSAVTATMSSTAVLVPVYSSDDDVL
jgi:hypothetical protein